jgi:hypothetical protein
MGGPSGIASADPRCLGAVYQLFPGYDLGAPQPVTAILGTLMINGERPVGRRFSNRTLVIPVGISAPTRTIVLAARELLMALVDQQDFPVQWLKEGGLPMLFDCFRAQASKPEYNVLFERQHTCKLTLTIPAMPFGRSYFPQALAFSGGVGGFSTSYAPIVLDTFGTVTGTGWSKATASSPVGAAAHWTNPLTSVPAVYTSVLSNLNLTGMTAISQWIGTALSPGAQLVPTGSTSDYGNLAVKYTLTDSTTHSMTFGQTWHKSPSRDTNHPVWYQVSTPIPQGQSFAYSSVASCVIQVTNSVNSYVAGSDVFLAGLNAVPPTTAQTTLPARGICYQLQGVVGTAPAPVSLQVGLA